MAFLGLLNPPKHKRFDYKPRYWDPDKEELKERLERAKGQENEDIEARKSRISGHFERRHAKGSESSAFRRREARRSNIRLAMVLAILILLVYLGLVTLPRFLSFFE